MQFKDVLVDAAFKQKLVDLAREGRSAHAQFFLAQPGSHALALAVALGQYLCCENPGEHDSCGECPSCKQFAKLSHPDLHLYFPNCTTKSVKKDPESSLFIKEFRDYVLQNDFHVDINGWLNILEGENKQASINSRDCSDILHHNNTQSHQDGCKVYILWCVDRLYHSAAPKLLKTLEEPESNSVFILISEEPDKILNTILSRTQLVKIPRLTDADLAEKLQQMYPDISPDEASDIAILADGNYNKAMHIVTDNEDQRVLLQQFEVVFDSVTALAQRKPLVSVQYEQAQEALAEVVAAGREYQKQYLQLMLRMLRNILMMNSNNSGLLKVTHQEQSVLDKYRGFIHLKQISVMTDLCNEALYHITRNGNSSLIFTDLYFKLVNAFNG
jgi:DNA polymerase-3 subunit delta'